MALEKTLLSSAEELYNLARVNGTASYFLSTVVMVRADNQKNRMQKDSMP